MIFVFFAALAEQPALMEDVSMAMTWRFPSRLADPLWGQLPVSHDTQESETPRNDDDSAAQDALPASATDPLSNPLTGERESFEAFFSARHRAIFAYLWRMTGEEEAANDLCQETFLRAWRQFERIRFYDRPEAWLLRVATNLALNHLRRRKGPVGGALPLDESIDPATSDPSWRFAVRDAVRGVLAELTPRQRAALILREAYGLTGDQLAQALGVSTPAAKMLLFRAREAFRARYERQEAGL
ncbi:MAG TPA: RNA polymerase sigma factor [Ktedonobacterales bacterium]|nr:RNA polymerase sigma factor [Ktedonobacterales bacterium]